MECGEWASLELIVEQELSSSTHAQLGRVQGIAYTVKDQAGNLSSSW